MLYYSIFRKTFITHNYDLYELILIWPFCCTVSFVLVYFFSYYLDLTFVVIHLRFCHSGILKNLLTYLMKGNLNEFLVNEYVDLPPFYHKLSPVHIQKKKLQLVMIFKPPDYIPTKPS